MKKIISLLLIIAVMSTFVACKKDETTKTDGKPATEQSVSEENNQAAEEGEAVEEELPVITKEEDLPEEYAPTEEVNQEDGSVDVKKMLLGKWKSASNNELALEFLEGMVTLSMGEKGMEGQYAIDMEKSVIYVELLAADGMIKNEFSFKIEDGNLKLLDQNGAEAFVKE